MPTLVLAVDVVQKMEVVNNALRLMMLQRGEQRTRMMAHFMKMNMMKYYYVDGQLEVFVKNMSVKMKNTWSTLTQKVPSNLKKIDDLILAFLRHHDNNI